MVNEIENRKIIELRYRLLPTIYNEMQKASATGVPAMRPLFLEFPEDAATWDRDDEFMWGQDILVAPVLKEVALEREVYLPPGDWYDFGSGALIAAAPPAAAKAGDETALSQTVGQTITVPVTLATLPLYVRAGGVVFSHPVVQHTGQLAGQPLFVTVYPSTAESTRTLYEDDGETMAYAKGAYCLRHFDTVSRERTVSVSVAACNGSYKPAARSMVIRVPVQGAVHVTVNGKTAQPRTSAQGWAEVQLPDTLKATEVSFNLQ